MWGTLCFRELHDTTWATHILVFLIIVLYVLAIGMLAANAVATSDDDGVHHPTTPVVWPPSQ